MNHYKNKKILVFADDKVIIANSKGNFQSEGFALQNIATNL